MSGSLPQTIPPQTASIGKADADGNVTIDVTWYLLFYNLVHQVLGTAADVLPPDPETGSIAEIANSLGFVELQAASQTNLSAQVATLQAQMNDLLQLVAAQQQQIITLSGLQPKQILYGSANGGVAQSVNFEFDATGNGMLFAGASFYLDNAGGDLLLKSKGKGVLDLRTSGGADVNLVNISSNTTGNGAIITAAGTDTDVTLHLRSQGIGNLVIGAGANPIAQFTGGTGSCFITIANDNTTPTIGTSAGDLTITPNVILGGTASLAAYILGTWTTPGFSAGDYTANGSMTWTVIAGNVTTLAYTIVNKMMTVAFVVVSTTVGGTPSTQLKIKIPASKTSTKVMQNPVSIFNNATNQPGYATTVAGGTVIDISLIGGGNYTAGTTSVVGELTFEIN